ncbi:transposase DNA-binding-containing protein [Noviherbaspirillum soli]
MEAVMSQEWAEKELAGIDLGDARLNKPIISAA